MTRLACLWMLAAAGAAGQVVEGTVLSTSTGSGAGGVRVMLEQVTTGAYRVYDARTDAEGHFRLDTVQDGIYTVRYLSPDYSWSGEFEEPARIVVAAGGKPVTLEAHVTRTPHVSGRVVDNRGNPVPKALVRLDSSSTGSVGESDAAGRFDLRLRPGAFTLAASAPADWKPPDPDPESGRALGWARTFYPAASTAQAADRIAVRPGVDVSDLELKLLALPVHAVRGVALDPDGKPAGKAAVTLQGLNSPEPSTQTESKADGAFEFPRVVAGEWRLGATVQASGAILAGNRQITVADGDVEGLKLRLAAPFVVRGRIVSEGGKVPAAVRFPSMLIRQVLEREEFSLFVSARPDAEGQFTFAKVYPGVYRLGATEAPPPYYFDSLRLGEVDVPALQMELTSGAAAITLVYKMNGGTVRGTVEKCASGEVLLLPQDAALRRSGIARRVRCDPGGRYEMAAVRPGEYYVLAFAGNGSEASAEWDDAMLQQAALVTVRAGEATAADLKAIPRPAY